MRSPLSRPCVLALGFAALLAASGAADAAVMLSFTNVGASTTAAVVPAGSTFSFSVKLNESSATDQVSGVDYQIQSGNALSAPVSGDFRFNSRNSSASTGGQFTFPNGLDDSSLQPVVLNPKNGTDLGTSTSSGKAVSGSNAPGGTTYEIADFSFTVLPATPVGVYTLNFVNTSYAGAPTDGTAHSFDSLGTFTVVVPEPATAGLAVIAATGLALRRRARR